MFILSFMVWKASNVFLNDVIRHFWLPLCNRWTEFNETSQETRSQHPRPSLCYLAAKKTKMAVLASDLLIYFIFFATTVKNSIKYERKKDIIVHSQVCVFRSIAKLSHIDSLDSYWQIYFYAKGKYRGIIEIQKLGDKTSSGEINLDIRTYASSKIGQDQVSGGVSVPCWHAAPVAYVLWKPCTIR